MKPPLSSSPSSSSSSVLRKPRQLSPYLFSLLVFIVFVAILYGEDVMCVFSHQLQLDPDVSDRPLAATRESTHLNSAQLAQSLQNIYFFRSLYIFSDREEERPETPIRDRQNRRELRRLQRAVGPGRYEAALRGGRVSVHPTTAHLHRAWPAGEGIPVLEMATSRLRSSKVLIFFLFNKIIFIKKTVLLGSSFFSFFFLNFILIAL